MYVPASFRETDIATLHAFMKRYSFATLITTDEEPAISHVPLILDPEKGAMGVLYGHFARANPHWQLDHTTRNSIAIFHGPHAYISPAWYRDNPPTVPTWNYAVVHALGKLTLIEDLQRTAALLEQIASVYAVPLTAPEKNPLPREKFDRLTHAVVGFEMPIEKLTGSFKLSQNRSLGDQLGAIEGLEATGDPESIALAAFTKTRLG